MEKTLPQFWSFNRAKDASLIKTENFVWQGPFSWTGYEQTNRLKPVPNIAGVYLITFEYKDGYILRSVGVTNSMKRRFLEHEREFKKGNYTILDVEYAKMGIRKEIWHGWEYGKAHQSQFLEFKDTFLKLIEKELSSYRIFVTEINDKRKRERLEAAILINVYASKKVWADLVDGGMHIRGRFNYEIPIKIRNISQQKIFGLPKIVEI
ncbi:hypothetical protein [Anaerobranca gottschalkii]|uniref:GIY-YIG domain-containing protein n=1 Tax=Anaerobranca gottschalkii DSM 13577 TaxID=1120990 RepID=A0A1I0BXD4_9FIRM|nr:hypothetical protein [Anaerobranca gottschalkii]SET11654.1 hypothetical protein SAMN03080614_10511 [Anaerobranca gottschalkii DSM 13577]